MTPLGKIEDTARHFELIRFEDRYGTPCSIQQSSIFDDEHADQPGATAIWLGVDRQTGKRDGMFDASNQTRMHIERAQVKALVAVLEQWLQFGSFTDKSKHGEK